DWIGEKVLRSTLRQYPASGYRLHYGPFRSTADTLIGDPQYGYPCPWLTTSCQNEEEVTYDAYHSSADQVSLMSAAGMKACTAALASYLYYLADFGTREVLEIARSETARLAGELRSQRRRLDKDHAAYIQDAHEQSLCRLQRWLWGGDRQQTMRAFNELRREVAAEVKKVRRSAPSLSSSARARRIPRRTAVLSPTSENMPPPIARKMSVGFPSWALFWADGKRTIAQIARRVRSEQSGVLCPRG
ncbi:uncharacterized protein METZ01_LOCUS473971, partial [marine metagenome]